MKIKEYIKDKIISIILYIITMLLLSVILYIFKLNIYIIIIINIILIINGISILIFNYLRKKNYYNSMINTLKKLDKKYLVLETLSEPHTYEETIINNVLYDINKSMIENIKLKEQSILDFKEFLEIWIHEIKIPIASLVLKCHNNKDKYGNDLISIVRKLDNYADQILYYVRSEQTEKDFLISEVNLKDIVKEVSLYNKDDLLLNNINIKINNIDYKVYTDKKWLLYIINQIINNSIKYKNEKNSSIEISVNKIDDKIELIIYDNGIGIKDKDISKVFNKSFTGSNGQNKIKSTGMGLYIVKNLIDKLGHNIRIESKENSYTKVIITFGINNLYNIS